MTSVLLRLFAIDLLFVTVPRQCSIYNEKSMHVLRTHATQQSMAANEPDNLSISWCIFASPVDCISAQKREIFCCVQTDRERHCWLSVHLNQFFFNFSLEIVHKN